MKTLMLLLFLFFQNILIASEGGVPLDIAAQMWVKADATGVDDGYRQALYAQYGATLEASGEVEFVDSDGKKNEHSPLLSRKSFSTPPVKKRPSLWQYWTSCWCFSCYVSAEVDEPEVKVEPVVEKRPWQKRLKIQSKELLEKVHANLIVRAQALHAHYWQRFKDRNRTQEELEKNKKEREENAAALAEILRQLDGIQRWKALEKIEKEREKAAAQSYEMAQFASGISMRPLNSEDVIDDTSF